jgi:hypothetical protein
VAAVHKAVVGDEEQYAIRVTMHHTSSGRGPLFAQRINAFMISFTQFFYGGNALPSYRIEGIGRLLHEREIVEGNSHMVGFYNLPEEKLFSRFEGNVVRKCLNIFEGMFIVAVPFVCNVEGMAYTFWFFIMWEGYFFSPIHCGSSLGCLKKYPSQ